MVKASRPLLPLLLLAVCCALVAASPAAAQSVSDVPSGGGCIVPAPEGSPVSSSTMPLQINLSPVMLRHPLLLNVAGWLVAPRDQMLLRLWQVALREPDQGRPWE